MLLPESGRDTRDGSTYCSAPGPAGSACGADCAVPRSFAGAGFNCRDISRLDPRRSCLVKCHLYLPGDDLARAISDDHLPWDPSVLGLLPFPSVLDMMRDDIAWTHKLGDAVLTRRPEVMDAVQRIRRKCKDFGYLTVTGMLR